VHVWSPLPEHWKVPAVQTPEHCPLVQAPLPHGTAVPHVPVASQVWSPVPMHWKVPGTQVPWHDAVPELTTHACAAHTTDVPQLPIELHVWTPLPEHCVVPGAQTPLQPPETQAWFPQSMGAPHWPAAQASTPLPAHRVVPAEQAPPSSDATSAVTSAGASSGDDASTVASSPASPVSVMVASGSATVESPGSASAEPSRLPGLVPMKGPSSPVASGAPRFTEVPPPQARTLPASAPARANRSQGRESIMRPLEAWAHPGRGVESGD
jgi:hypothetical protein